MQPSTQRELCLRCFRSLATCFCSRVTPIEPRTEFVLLQHPLERKKSVGTARMTHLTLKCSKLVIGRDFAESAQVNAILSDPRNSCFVLYPGADSTNIEEELPATMQAASDTGRKIVVFVIDGTWNCAKNMLRDSPNLRALPKISFHPNRVSEYGFRRQPHEYCLSTLEAVHKVLGILEPELNASGLMQLFREMVKTQLAFTT